MNELWKLIRSEKGRDTHRIVLLLAVGFLYPKFEKIETRLTLIEAKVSLMHENRNAKTTHETHTNVFSTLSPLRLHAVPSLAERDRD